MDTANTKPLTLVFFFVAQSLCRVVAHILFSFKIIGKEKIPKDGACVLVSNHISFVDWLLISSVSPRPIRFVLYIKYYMGPFRWLFDLGQVVPICSKDESKEIYDEAFEKISKHLDYGRMVCIFPEGMITTDGQMHAFKRGIEKIIRRNRVPVIPSKLSYSLWGHWSTRSLERFKVWIRPKVVFAVSDLIQPEEVTAFSLEEVVRNIKV
jgi:1-acyl-sn-glycerol-3-phosphate acyltransferase